MSGTVCLAACDDGLQNNLAVILRHREEIKQQVGRRDDPGYPVRTPRFGQSSWSCVPGTVCLIIQSGTPGMMTPLTAQSGPSPGSSKLHRSFPKADAAAERAG